LKGDPAVLGKILYRVDPCYWSELRGRRGCDHMVVEFTTTCAISAYHQ
jgi:hypothetical protein